MKMKYFAHFHILHLITVPSTRSMLHIYYKFIYSKIKICVTKSTNK